MGRNPAALFTHAAAWTAKSSPTVSGCGARAGPTPGSARSARALSPDERASVLAILHSERFQDRSPAAVQATLLDEGHYHCSTRTMYRILEQEGESGERRDQLVHPSYQSPSCWPPRPTNSGAGTSPNCWARLSGPTSTSMSSSTSSAATSSAGWSPIGKRRTGQAAHRGNHRKHQVPAGQLTIHADRGRVMTSKPVAFLMADLGVTKTHSRPYVSDDNPYSESHFRTLKYRPEFPDRFGCIQDSRAFCQQFFQWYNEEHRHSGIGLLTPAMVHFGLAQAVRYARARVDLPGRRLRARGGSGFAG